MKKRGIFSLVLLLILSMMTVTAADYANLGTAGELVVTGQALYESEQNTASTVSIITAEEIEQLQPASTAELIGEALGTGFSSYGALGSLQNVQLRGSSSAQVDIYVDGVRMNSAHDGNFDLSLIPVSTIDHVEIVRSGTGSSGTANAIGGMVYISTKKGEPTDKPFTVSFENGSFMPEKYLTATDEEKVNWLGLVDSQKADISYANTFDKLSIGASLGGQIAQNNYTYWYSQEQMKEDPDAWPPTYIPDPKYDSIRLRTNAKMWNIYGGVKLSYAFTEDSELTGSNTTQYRHVGNPGGLDALSNTDYQTDMITIVSLAYDQRNMLDGLMDLHIGQGYVYNRTFAQTAWGDSTHNKHQTQSSIDAKWNFGDMANMTTGISFDWDYVDSTDIGKNSRYNPNLYANGSIYFLNGNLSMHPMARIGWTNDFGFVPTAALGIVGIPMENLQLSANVSYAKTNPNFSQLYWPNMSNPNLKPEKAIAGEFVVSYDLDFLSYEGSAFVKNIFDKIANDLAWIPQNISHVFLTGTEQQLSIMPVEGLKLTGSYLLNYSWDLSETNTFASDVRVANVRMHTAKFSASYDYGIGSITLSGQYMGKSGYAKAVFLMDMIANFKIANDYTVYLAVDNLLNTRYELQTGYPMPGTKIRIGGSAKF